MTAQQNLQAVAARKLDGFLVRHFEHSPARRNRAVPHPEYDFSILSGELRYPLHRQTTLPFCKMHPDTGEHDQIEGCAIRHHCCQAWQTVRDPFNRRGRMKCRRLNPKCIHRLNGNDLMPHFCESRGVAPGARTDIENPAWRRGDQVKNRPVKVRKPYGFVPLKQSIGFFLVSLRTADKLLWQNILRVTAFGVP